MKKHGWLLSLSLLLLMCDFGLKFLVHQTMSGATLIPVFTHFFSVNFFLVHTTNTGAAFGLFPSMQIYLVAVRLIASAAFIFYLASQSHPALKRTALYLLLAGTVGNALDYFLYGHVVDMFLFTFGPYSYPVFNIADSLICIGVVFMLIHSFRIRHARAI